MERTDKFIRDTHSKAIINTDVEAFRKYKQQKKNSKKLESLVEEIDLLRDEMSEIKNLLKQLASR